MQTHFETIQYNNLSMQNTITSKSLNFMSKLCQIAKHLQHHLLHTHTHTHTLTIRLAERLVTAVAPMAIPIDMAGAITD